MKIYVARKEQMVDISKYCGDISWNDSIDTLGVQLSFAATKKINLNVGDYFQLKKDNVLVTDGIAVTKNKSFFKNKFNVFDFAWFLNESEEIVQFKNIDSNKAIKQLLAKYNVKLGAVDAPSISLTYIYKDKKVSEVISHILSMVTDETGQKFRMEMRNGKFYIEKYTEISVSPKYQNAINIAAMNSLANIGEGFSYSESIQDLKNKVVLTSDEEKSKSIIAEVDDQESIKKYGLLQEVKTVDKKDIAKAKNIANNTLKNLNRKSYNINITIPGDINLRSGRLISINNKYMNGKYLIKSTNHSYKNGIHKTSLTIGDDKDDRI